MTGSPTLADELMLLITEVALSDAEPFDHGTDLLLGGLVDSMGVVQIVEWLEERTGSEIDPADVVLENFRSIEAIVAYVDRELTPTGS